MRSDTTPDSIGELMPHTGESIWLDGVRTHDATTTVTHSRVDSARHGRSFDGSVPNWAAIEFMAQTMSVHEALVSRELDGPPNPGFLVSVAQLELHAPRFVDGDDIEITTRRLRGRPALGVLTHQCEIRRADPGTQDDLLATARLTLSLGRHFLG